MDHLIAQTAGGSQSVATVGFQPEAVIFFWTKQTAAGFNTDVSIGYGFATGPANEAAIAYAERSSNTTQTRRWQSQSRSIVIMTSGNSSTADAEAELTSMDLGGFTINWTNAPSSGWIVHYMALGGSDIINATVNSFTPTGCPTPPCSENVTNVGFAPDFLMFLSIDNNTLDSFLDHAKASIGFAERNGGTPTQGGLYSASRDARANTKSYVRQRTDRAIMEKGTPIDATSGL